MPNPKPLNAIAPNSALFENAPLVKATGFREYDARWWFGHPGSRKEPELNLMGVQALGLGLGTLLKEQGVPKEVVVGHDFRGYSSAIKYALVAGLLAAGCKVHDMASPCRPWPISPSSTSMCRPSPWSRPRTTTTAGPA